MRSGVAPAFKDKIVVLRRNRRRVIVFVDDASWYQFRVAPTCPPSRRLHMHGGRTYLCYNSTSADLDDYEERAYTVPDLIADLADTNSVYTDVVFTNANYYQLFYLELRTPAILENPLSRDWSFYLHGTGDEFETAAEAEAWLNSETFQESSPWDHGSIDIVAYPLCGLVLRNDGTVGGGCHILPVDYVNRGRSYMWPTDVRPRQDIYA